MIKKLIRQMLTAQILSALTVSLCLLIDSIVIGRFLGENAIAAYGLANPILLIIGAFGGALSAGVQVTCSKSLGKGSQEETNQGYSSAIAMAAAFSIPFTIIVFVLSRPISSALGANSEQLLYDTNAYLRGFIIGAPATMGHSQLLWCHCPGSAEDAVNNWTPESLWDVWSPSYGRIPFFHPSHVHIPTTAETP